MPDTEPTKSNVENDTTYTREAFARKLQITTRTLDRMCRKGVLTPFRCGRVVRFNNSQLVALFK